MHNAPLDDAELQRTVDCFNEHGGNKSHAARELGIERKTLSQRLAKAAQRGLINVVPLQPVPVGHFVKGVSTLVDAYGAVKGQWIKTAPENEEIFIDAIRAAFAEYDGEAAVIPAPTDCETDLLSVYPIADLHVGMLSWGKETGDPYDLNIACERLLGTMGRLVRQSPQSRKALVLNLGDWFHINDHRNMTPRSGNVLDVDSRYMKVLQTGVKLMMQAIDLALAKHEEVTVVNVPGNHDPESALALTVALGAFYSANPRVHVVTDPAHVWYYRFGETLIGVTHGHTMKPDRMALAMAERCRSDWGQTAYHYAYFGHIHHETAKEVGGVRCESFQTLAAKDAHAYQGGYSAGQSLSSITIHRVYGETGRHRVNLPPPDIRAAA